LASTKRRSRKAKPKTQSKPKPVPKPVPKLADNLRVLTLCGVEYFMQWEKLFVGASFFLPTTATPVQVRAAIAPASKFFKFRFEVRSRCEYGRYGARVWRVY
jgi:hypothetical protein